MENWVKLMMVQAYVMRIGGRGHKGRRILVHPCNLKFECFQRELNTRRRGVFLTMHGPLYKSKWNNASSSNANINRVGSGSQTGKKK